jgi:hypothetical protein
VKALFSTETYRTFRALENRIEPNLGAVERWFGHLDTKAIRRGVFLSVPDLKDSIEASIKAWNQQPQPFVWTAERAKSESALSRERASADAHPTQRPAYAPTLRESRGGRWPRARELPGIGAGPH